MHITRWSALALIRIAGVPRMPADADPARPRSPATVRADAERIDDLLCCPAGVTIFRRSMRLNGVHRGRARDRPRRADAFAESRPVRTAAGAAPRDSDGSCTLAQGVRSRTE